MLREEPSDQIYSPLPREVDADNATHVLAFFPTSASNRRQKPNRDRDPLITQVPVLPHTSPVTSYLFTPFDNEPLTTKKRCETFIVRFPKIGSFLSPDSQKVMASGILLVLL